MESWSRKEQRMEFRGTTILAVKKDGKVAMAGDGQVTLDKTVMKGHARKVRKIYDGKILVGFAGATADAPRPSGKASRLRRR